MTWIRQISGRELILLEQESQALLIIKTPERGQLRQDADGLSWHGRSHSETCELTRGGEEKPPQIKLRNTIGSAAIPLPLAEVDWLWRQLEALAGPPVPW